jgi:hypothetical protein
MYETARVKTAPFAFSAPDEFGTILESSLIPSLIVPRRRRSTSFCIIEHIVSKNCCNQVTEEERRYEHDCLFSVSTIHQFQCAHSSFYPTHIAEKATLVEYVDFGFASFRLSCLVDFRQLEDSSYVGGCWVDWGLGWNSEKGIKRYECDAVFQQRMYVLELQDGNDME